jgi:hypothetical protein
MPLLFELKLFQLVGLGKLVRLKGASGSRRLRFHPNFSFYFYLFLILKPRNKLWDQSKHGICLSSSFFNVSIIF